MTRVQKSLLKGEQWRETFLVNFSDNELESMFVLFCKYGQLRRKKNRCIREWFRGFPPKKMVGRWHLILFGEYQRDNNAFRAVTGQVDAIRDKLKSVRLPPKPKKPPNYPFHFPQMPKGLWVENPAIGRAFVTKHAWKRLFEFYYELIRHEESLARTLMLILTLSFGQSALVSKEGELSRGALTICLWDEKAGLKYILGGRAGKHQLITVVSTD